MNRSTHLTRLLGTTVLAGVFGAAFASQASAQTAPTPTQPAAAQSDANALEEVVVTGTRIRRPNLEANNPISVVDQRSIALSGITDVADLLQRQPQVGIGANTNNTVNTVRNQGLETLSLRNLGSNRTLTLVNGHRQVGGGQGSSAVDVNTISPTMIDRVDIVTGGSSALYGADAIAGVVNFILKRDLEGVSYKFQYGDSYHGGGTNEFASISVGHNFDHNRGNVSLSLDYNNSEPIYRYQRNYAVSGLAGLPNPARSTNTNIANVPAFIPLTGVRTNIYGSSAQTGDVRFYTPAVISPLTGYSSAASTTNTGPFLTFNPAGTAAVNFDKGTLLRNNAGTIQTASINCPGCLQSYLDALQTGVEREGVSGQGRYDLIQDRGWIRNMEVYAEGKFFHDKGFTTSNSGTFAGSSVAFEAANKASGGLPAAGAAYPIRLDNAYIPDNLKPILAATPVAANGICPNLNSPCLPRAGGKATGAPVLLLSRIDNDLGNREYKTRYDSGEAVLGFRGAFKNDWHFDAFVNYGETDSTAINYDRNELKFFDQIDAVRSPGGQIVCRSTLTNPGNGCIPLNLFSTQNSAAAANYSYLHTVEHDKITLVNVQANLSGDLFRYPALFSGTDLPVSFALGFEYRRESSSAQPDPLVQNGTVFGNFITPTVGAYNTKEGYGELNIPVLADLPFVKRLEFDFSGRIQDFSTTGVDGTYGVSGNWVMNDDIKFRGVYSKAVRAPNISELFAGGSISFAGIADPCDSNNVGLGTQPANRLANCKALLGALAVGPGGSYAFTQSPATKQTQTTGNVNLDPERATTYTAGLVYTPHFFKNFSVTFDYYDIKIKGAIASLSISSIVNNCVDSPTLANQFCGAITRSGDGNLFLVQNSVFNVAAFRTKGEDLGFSYVFNVNDLPFMPDLGRLTLNGNVNHVGDLLYNPVAGDDTTRVQYAGALTGPQPRIRGEARVTWDWRNFTASYAAEYIGAMNLSNSDKPLDYAYERIPEFVQHDLRLEYRWRGQSAYVGINNFTDEDPPFVPGVFTGTGNASIYGPVGRFIYVGLSGHF